MKTSLKRSEIIEQLKRFFPSDKLVSIVFESIVVESEFSTYYFLMIKRDDKCYQTCTIHIHYGWIEYELGNAYSLNYPKSAYCIVYSQYFIEMYNTLKSLQHEHDYLPF